MASVAARLASAAFHVTSDDPPFAFIENRQVLGLPLVPVKDLQVVGDFNRRTGELYYKDVLVAQGWAHEDADTISESI